MPQGLATVATDTAMSKTDSLFLRLRHSKFTLKSHDIPSAGRRSGVLGDNAVFTPSIYQHVSLIEKYSNAFCRLSHSAMVLSVTFQTFLHTAQYEVHLWYTFAVASHTVLSWPLGYHTVDPLDRKQTILVAVHRPNYSRTDES